MDVHRSTSLELGDLGVGDADLATQRRNAKSAQGRELSGQVRDRPAPEGSECRVPQGRGLVVIAVGTERAADPGIAGGMSFETAEGDFVFAGLRWSTWPAGAHATRIDDAAMDCAERWRRERREHEWV